MAEFEESPERTRRDPGTTSVDGGTARDGGVPGPRSAPLVRLPGELGARFAVLGELPVQGAESDLLHVADQQGAEFVVKVYRRGYRADPEVWRKLPELASPHVVRIVETGHADGRDYEVIEYLPAGNLRALMSRPMTAELVTAAVEQLADGLERLHVAGIVHRDLKPENVLIAETAPLRLVIADFGLSRVIEQSVVFASSSRTLAYAAPESLSGQVSPARDWWSLGMIVRELLTGRPPFAGMSETAVVDHLATRAIDNTDLADGRLRLLSQGLLTRDPRKRWGLAQVREWLGGASPEVVQESQPEAGRGLLFNRRRFSDRSELARELIEHWAEGARYFFGRGEQSEAWRALREWLEELGDDSRIELIDAWLTTGATPPDVKLLHLVRWLDPEFPPHYLGTRVTAEDLPGLAGLASDPSHPDHDLGCRIGRDLWRYGLLSELGEAAIDRSWRGRVEAWNALVSGLRPHLPATAAARLPDAGSAQDSPPAVLLGLLALAADPGYAAPALAGAVAQARESIRERVRGSMPERGRGAVPERGRGAVPERGWWAVPELGRGAVPAEGRAGVQEPAAWFGWLVDGAGEDPLRLLAVLQTFPEALAEVEAAVRRQETVRQAAAARAEQWEAKEGRRLAAVKAATFKAVLWSIPILVLWVVGGFLVDGLFGSHGSTASVGSSQGPKGLSLVTLIVAGLLAWGVELGTEVVLARRQGGDYLPYGPWAWISKVLGIGGRGLSAASQAISGKSPRENPRGCGFLLMAGLLPLILILMIFSVLSALAEFLWIMVLLAVPIVHATVAGLRLHRWRQAHEERKEAALSESAMDGDGGA